MRLLSLSVLVFTLFLAGCSSSGGDGGGDGGDGSSDSTPTPSDAEIVAAIGSIDPVAQSRSWEQEMLDAINHERDEADLTALIWNDQLAGAATYYARDMEANGAWSHIGTVHDNRLVHRLQAADYRYRNAGENIAKGQTSVAEVMQAWMESPGHKANILNPDYTEVGLAEIDRNWVQVFGRPLASSKPQPINQ